MSILIPALGVACGALCVWLGVRFVNRREAWAKWTLAGALGLPVLYMASFGPVWTRIIEPRRVLPDAERDRSLDACRTIYRPIFCMMQETPEFSDAIQWYCKLWEDNQQF